WNDMPRQWSARFSARVRGRSQIAISRLSRSSTTTDICQRIESNMGGAAESIVRMANSIRVVDPRPPLMSPGSKLTVKLYMRDHRMFDNLREDWITYERDIWRQGLWVMAVYRFGRWRYGFTHRIVRAPLS